MLCVILPNFYFPGGTVHIKVQGQKLEQSKQWYFVNLVLIINFWFKWSKSFLEMADFGQHLLTSPDFPCSCLAHPPFALMEKAQKIANLKRSSLKRAQKPLSSIFDCIITRVCAFVSQMPFHNSRRWCWCWPCCWWCFGQSWSKLVNLDADADCV